MDITLYCVLVFSKRHKKFKEEHKEVKSGSKRGRPLTSRTLVNERINQMECGDRQLTVRMISSQGDMKKDNV